MHWTNEIASTTLNITAKWWSLISDVNYSAQSMLPEIFGLLINYSYKYVGQFFTIYLIITLILKL